VVCAEGGIFSLVISKFQLKEYLFIKFLGVIKDFQFMRSFNR